jgi:hypothetical protein
MAANAASTASIAAVIETSARASSSETTIITGPSR